MLNTNYYRSEAYTNTECGLNGIISLPYVPISKYEKHTNTVIHPINYMYGTPNYGPMDNANISGRTDAVVMELARQCDGTPGCVSFDTTGNLYTYMLDTYENKLSYNTGLDTYTRKCGKGIKPTTAFSFK
jgi:hypothetical protein